MRLYECEGSKTKTEIAFSDSVSKAKLTNILEDEKESLICANNSVSLEFKPFEIKTIKVYR